MCNSSNNDIAEFFLKKHQTTTLREHGTGLSIRFNKPYKFCRTADKLHSLCITQVSFIILNFCLQTANSRILSTEDVCNVIKIEHQLMPIVEESN